MNATGTSTPAARIAEQCNGRFGRNDDATLTARPETLSAAGSYISREYGDAYLIGQVSNANTGAVFSVRTSDGSTFYLAVDNYGNVERFDPND